MAILSWDQPSEFWDAWGAPAYGSTCYLLMLAKDETAATRIKQTLTSNPSNPRARFVDFTLSEMGLQLTRS